jgi:hypothetical protein
MARKEILPNGEILIVAEKEECSSLEVKFSRKDWDAYKI